MANRSGQSSSITDLQRGERISAPVPVVNYARTPGVASNAGKASFALADVLKDISVRVENRLDILAQDEAARAGAVEGAKGIPSRQDQATIRGRAFNAAAQDAVLMRVDLEGRKKLSELEAAAPADATAFRSKADAYVKGHAEQLSAFDPALGQRYAAEFEARALAAEDRIKDRHRAIVRDQQIEQTLRLQLAVQDELATDAAALFSGRAEDAEATLARMMSNSAKMVDAANQIGPDGTPLFSARERVAAERQAQQSVSEQIGLSWLKSQPNMLDAYQSWQKGEAAVDLISGDGIKSRINLREMLGETGYQMAGEAFASELRSELALRNQIEAANDRAFKQQSDALFQNMTVLAQDGGLTLQTVESARRSLEPDRYLSLRALAKTGGAAVSDGSVYARLAVQDADGQDIRDELRNEYTAGRLERSDYLKLYESNSSRINKGVKDPVVTGRDYLAQGLGALSQEIGLPQSVSIGGATAEYEIEINEFISQKQRQPTVTEARDIAENVRARYSVLSVEDSLLSLPLPRSMTQAEKLDRSLNSAMIAEKVKQTNDVYLRKHSGNADRRNADPEYMREIRLLKNYSDVLKLKETGNARSPK